MAKTKPIYGGFEEALAHMKVGRRAIRRIWEKEYLGMRLDDTGLGSRGEFIRVDTGNHQHRYPLATEDILADDWKLL